MSQTEKQMEEENTYRQQLRNEEYGKRAKNDLNAIFKSSIKKKYFFSNRL